MNVFNGVTPRLFSYRCVLSEGFDVTYGLKPQVTGIKISTLCRRSTFQA